MSPVVNYGQELQTAEWFLDFDDALQKLHARYDWFSLQTPKGSMNTTELFYIYCSIRKYEPELLFESGVASGRSTAILAECMRPFGTVVAARFDYPEDGWQLHPFATDYANLTIIQGRGEDVAQTLDKAKKLVAVVDGPKPIGCISGRPGWLPLMDALIRCPKLMAVFQHDIDDLRNKAKFDAYFYSNMQSRFSCAAITEAFLRRYRLYGMADSSRNFRAALGRFERL